MRATLSVIRPCRRVRGPGFRGDAGRGPARGGPYGDGCRSSILVGLLWCVALLSVVVIGVLHLVRLDLMMGKNYGDRIQARYLALAGIEKAKALLYQEARNRSRSARNHSGALYNAPQQFRAVPLGRGQFGVFRAGRPEEGGGVIYGVADEESRLNVNYASADELSKLEGMTPDIVAALIDWRDSDNQVTPAGAEADYYAALTPPYQPRNGPFQTIRELMMVRGLTRDLLLGSEPDLPPRPPPDENHETGADAGAADSPALDSGWASLLTVSSAVQNVNAAGEERVNVQSADENALTMIKGISPEIAKAIVAYRAQNQLRSVADLLDVTAPPRQNPDQLSPNPASTPPGQAGPPAGGNNPGPNPPAANRAGPKVVSPNLLEDIADDLTAQSEQELPGVVNINTASLDVLACLPGMSRDVAQAVISFRQSNGFYPNIAWLLKVPGLSPALFKQLALRVTARSETFRILRGKSPFIGSAPAH
jgi:DNA uptake protein ComE-like DNA-binding protein